MPTAHPEKIYVELTTRCNLRCPMCLKFAEGSCITEGDMDLALFERLLPALGTVRTLVLNGLGEPLLHPELETMVALARTALPADGTIGFQSNGLLLDRGRAERLLAAGLDTVCLSVDDLDGSGGAGADAGHQVRPVERPSPRWPRPANGRAGPFASASKPCSTGTTPCTCPSWSAGPAPAGWTT